MTAESAPSRTPQEPPADERFRYIGFGVYPKRIPRFWRSDAEEREMVDRIHLGETVASLERDNSLLHDEAMTLVDRVILTVTGALMAATTLMPWVQYRTIQGTDFGLSWGAALGTLFGGFSTAFDGGIAVGVSAILALILLIGGPLIGLWILTAVWMGAKSPEAYQLRLRQPLKVGYALLFGGMAIGILAFVGGHIPGYETWQLIDPGEKYGFGAFVTVTSFGPYVIMAMGLVAGVKSGDL